MDIDVFYGVFGKFFYKFMYNCMVYKVIKNLDIILNLRNIELLVE